LHGRLVRRGERGVEDEDLGDVADEARLAAGGEGRAPEGAATRSGQAGRVGGGGDALAVDPHLVPGAEGVAEHVELRGDGRRGGDGRELAAAAEAGDVEVERGEAVVVDVPE